MTGGAERAFTLIETLIAVAIVVLIAGFGVETLATHPAHGRSTAIRFAALVADARSLAAGTAEIDTATGSGASIGVTRDGDTYVATLYKYRPIDGAAHQPQAAPNTPPLRTSTAIRLAVASDRLEPPFAIFISASGHASVAPGFAFGVSAPLTAEPACPQSGGIGIAFNDTTFDRTYPVSCEMAQLELESNDKASSTAPRRLTL